MLHSLYAYCTSSILGLHDIVFVLLVSTLIAITFSINKKWKNEPYKFSNKPELRDEIKDLDKRAIYAKELKRFEEIKAEIIRKLEIVDLTDIDSW